jgi:putative endonuclease
VSARPAASRRSAGAEAEELAAAFLARHGLHIVERNWRRRCGEIDLVARDGDVLVFVEVRLRRRGDFGGAAASITAAKRARLIAAAEQYLAGLPHVPACRVDAVLLDALDPARIEWLRDVVAA